MINHTCANCGRAIPASEHFRLRGSLSLTRHCRVPMNDNHVIIGSIDDRPTEIGLNQAREAAKQLKASGGKITSVKCSPQARAAETALIFAQEFGHCTIIQDDRLRERCVGVYEGRHEFPGMLELFMGSTPIEEAESIESLEERTKSILADAEQDADEDSLFVTHALPLLKMLEHITGSDAATMNLPKNCEVITFRFYNQCLGCGSIFARAVGQ